MPIVSLPASLDRGLLTFLGVWGLLVYPICHLVTGLLCKDNDLHQYTLQEPAAQ